MRSRHGADITSSMAKPNNKEVARLFDDAAERFDQQSSRYAMKRRTDALAEHVNGRCLELGGGTGWLAGQVSARSQAIHSDISPGMCRAARDRLGCPSLCCDAEAVPLAEASIDTAVSSEMIYYLDHPERFVREAFRVLRAGGRLVISTTNPTMTVLERGRTLLRKLGFRGMFFDDGSPKFMPLARLVAMLETVGFTVESTRKIVLLPFAPMDWLNRLLERTPLRHLGLFMIVVATKR